MFDDGLRLRFAGGYGGDTHEGYRHAGHKAELASFKGRMTFADILVGYLKRFGPLTSKGFVGASAIRHDITPLDPSNPLQGLDYGPKVVLELWLNMGSDAWSSVDLNWTSAHQTYASRVRTGYRVLDEVSVGLRPALMATRSIRMPGAARSSATSRRGVRFPSLVALLVNSSRMP